MGSAATSSAIGPVQKALYDRMAASAELAAIVGTRIYDGVPENVRYPYVAFNSFTASSWRTHSRPGEEVMATLDIYSENAGYKQGEDILSVLQSLFGDAVLAVDGYDCVRCYYEYSTAFRTPKNTRRFAVRYRIQVLEAA